MTIREEIELRETLFNPYATQSKNSLGREKKEVLDDYRTCFSIDRDRIIHSHAFRREKDKTQVFILAKNDHIMNRLTHTLEVAQIAKSIANALNLNEILAEAIALGHDTAHTCFGHSGERALDRVSSVGYNHAEEAYRRLNVISGLNLTTEVLDGIRKHSGLSNTPRAITLEGQIAPFADKIAYLTSDMENAISLGLIKDIPERFKKSLGSSKSDIMRTLIRSIIDESHSNDHICMDESLFAELKAFREFNFQEIYYSQKQQEETKKAEYVVEYLYDYFMKHPEQIKDWNPHNPIERQVVDYIAGMTDKYALDIFTTFC